MRTKKPNPKAPVLGYVPDLLPDELLYSFLGRLAAYNALKNPKECLLNLFGADGIVASVDLPVALTSLQEHLAEQSPFDSVEQMIDSATLYPYHRPFLSSERAKRVRSILLNGGGGRLKTLLGRVANRFGANPSLRFCPLCRRSDIKNYGAAYWHRIHQLPGVSSCATHGIDLFEHIWPSKSPNRQRFHVVPLSPAERRVSGTKSLPSQLAFAKLSAELLTISLPIVGTATWQATYKTAACRKGYVDANGLILYDRIALGIRAHYRDFVGFQHRERVLSTPKHPLAWLWPMFERPDRSSHPILHLLLIGFLFGSVRGFARNLTRTTAAQSNVNSGVRETPEEVGHPDRATALLRNSEITCRQVASILRISVGTVVSRRKSMGIPVSERPKLLNPKLRTSIESALIRGALPALVAKRFGVSVATVYRLRRQSSGVLRANARMRFVKERDIRRNRWCKATQKFDGRGVQELRRQQGATYAWLYRNDRVWLSASLRKIMRVKQISSERVDWDSRDRILCKEVSIQVRELLRQRQRPRITVTLLIRPLGDAVIRRNISRLPRLRQLLANVQESVEQYRMYRVDCAISQLRKEGMPLDLWRIQREAGIRRWDEDLVTHALQRIGEKET